jgi:hypothetical protein
MVVPEAAEAIAPAYLIPEKKGKMGFSWFFEKIGFLERFWSLHQRHLVVNHDFSRLVVDRAARVHRFHALVKILQCPTSRGPANASHEGK